MDRDCNKCVWHTDGNCKKWDCEYKTVEDIRTDAIDEFREKVFNKFCRLTLSMYNFKLFDDALQEAYKELKENNND